MNMEMTIYTTKSDAMTPVVMRIPFDTPRCDLRHLEDNLLIRCYSGNGLPLGYTTMPVTNERFDELLAEAIELAEGR